MQFRRKYSILNIFQLCSTCPLIAIFFVAQLMAFYYRTARDMSVVYLNRTNNRSNLVPAYRRQEGTYSVSLWWYTSTLVRQSNLTFNNSAFLVDFMSHTVDAKKMNFDYDSNLDYACWWYCFFPQIWTKLSMFTLKFLLDIVTSAFLMFASCTLLKYIYKKRLTGRKTDIKCLLAPGSCHLWPWGDGANSL